MKLRTFGQKIFIFSFNSMSYQNRMSGVLKVESMKQKEDSSMSKRRRFTAEFKSKVALDALSGELTISQLAGKYGVHPNMISAWKRKVKEGVVDLFSENKGRKEKNHEAELKELHAKIGQLTVENDFLQKAFVRR